MVKLAFQVKADEQAEPAPPKAPEPAVTTVAGKETTIVKIAANGEIERKLSAKPLEEVDQIVVVVDPRAAISSFDLLKEFVGKEWAKPKPALEEWEKTPGCPEELFGFLLPAAVSKTAVTFMTGHRRQGPFSQEERKTEAAIAFQGRSIYCRGFNNEDYYGSIYLVQP